MDNFYNKIFFGNNQYYFPVFTFKRETFFLVLYFNIDYYNLTNNIGVCFSKSSSIQAIKDNFIEIPEFQFVFDEQVQNNFKEKLKPNFHELCKEYCFNYSTCGSIKFLSKNSIDKINKKIEYINNLLFKEGD